MPNTRRGSLNTLATRIFVASLVAVPLFSRATRAATGDEDVIRELNAGYVRAFLTSDADWYDRHLTPDFVCILTTGTVVDRTTFLENARKPHAVVSYDLSEITVRQHGDVALVSALGTWKRKDGSTGRTRYVDVWVRKAGAWKAVSAQLTALPS
jgi:ketosteroid isomerase-like protein